MLGAMSTSTSRNARNGLRHLHVTAATTAKEVINRYSRTVTQPKQQGASQAMLYATEGIETDEDLNKAMVGVASVW